jgi:hypothetical protein
MSNPRGVAFTQEARAVAMPLMESFSDVAMAVLRALCQNYVFTTADVAGLIAPISFESKMLDALDIFRDCVSNPSVTGPIENVFDFDSKKREAVCKLSSFRPATAGMQQHLRIEDDGHRSAASMARLLGAIDEATFADRQVAVVLECVRSEPSPPFDCAQLLAVLAKFDFSRNQVEVLKACVGPKIVYPLTCAEVVRVLDTYVS